LEQNPDKLKAFISSIVKANLIKTQTFNFDLSKVHFRNVELDTVDDMLMLGFGMF
jgi:hypothetical protein